MPPGMLRTPAAAMASASVASDVADLLGPVACSYTAAKLTYRLIGLALGPHEG